MMTEMETQTGPGRELLSIPFTEKAWHVWKFMTPTMPQQDPFGISYDGRPKNWLLCAEAERTCQRASVSFDSGNIQAHR